MFTQITKSYQRREQHRQWHRGWYCKNGKVKKQLAQDQHIKAFANDVVEIFQHVDVEQNKYDNEECDQERADKCVQNKFVDFFHVRSVEIVAPEVQLSGCTRKPGLKARN